MKKRISVLGIAVLLLLVFAGISYGALVDVVPDDALLVVESSNIANLVDFLYSDQFSSMMGGSVDINKQREEVNNTLGFDALDPEFLKKLFENGIVVSLTGLSETAFPEILIVLSPKNKLSFLNFIKALEKKTGLKEEVTSYKGVNITKLPIGDLSGDGPKEIAWSMIGENIVLGISIVPVKEAIEVSKGEKGSISKSANYINLKNRVSAKLGNAPFFLYFAMDKIGPIVEELKAKLPKEAVNSLENSLAIFKMMKPGALGGTSDENGTKLYFTSEIPDNYKKIYADMTLPKFASMNLFPKNTFIFLGGLMPLSWEDMKNMLPPASKKAVEDSFAQLKNQMGLDIEQMFLNWLDKEFAIGVFDPTGMLPKLGLLLGYKDKTAAQNALNMIVGMVGPSLGGQPQDKTYEGLSYKAIENPMFPLGFGFIGDRLVVASGIENMIDVLKGNVVGLGKNETIGRVVSHPNVTSILYIDIATSLSIIERLAGMGGGLDEDTKKILNAIKKVKDIILWSGYEKDGYTYSWLEIENAK